MKKVYLDRKCQAMAMITEVRGGKKDASALLFSSLNCWGFLNKRWITSVQQAGYHMKPSPQSPCVIFVGNLFICGLNFTCLEAVVCSHTLRQSEQSTTGRWI